MNYSLCDKYGFDETGRRRRIELFGFQPGEHRLANTLHAQVITPHGARIIDAFYDELMARPETALFLDGGRKVPRLKVTHADYLDTLGIAFDSADYFEHRLRVGMAHAHIGMPLSLYVAAYRLLEDLIIDHFPAALFRPPQTGLDLLRFLGRIIKLDMSLAIETYHQSQIQDLIRSVHSLADEKERLSREVREDSLTALASRRHLEAVLANEVAVARRSGQPLCVAMADLDHFKHVNDELGHLVGDKVLKEVGRRLEAAVRGHDIVGRYGGEEFLLVLPSSTLETGRQVAERVRERIHSEPVQADGHRIPVTISLGVAALADEETPESLLARADEALYAAKQAGRNRVVAA